MSLQKCMNMDVNSQRKFIDFFNKNDTHSMTFRFFDRGDYYSIHGKDTEIATKTSVKSSIVIKLMNPDSESSLKYASINKNVFEKLARDLLLVKNYRVEVYKYRGKDNWTIEFKGSPGNLSQFEDLLFNSGEPEILNNLLMSVQLISSHQQKKISIGCVDTTEHIISVAEFEDSDFYTELEATIVILGPKECLLPSFNGEYEKIKEVLERNGLLVTQHKKSDFVTNPDFLQDLGKLVRFKKGQKKSVHTISELKFDTAMGCVAAGIRYLEIIQEESNLGQFEVKLLNFNRFVHLDVAAVSALNLFPPAGINHRSAMYKWQSVLGVLDRCKTNQGRRMLNQWIKQPLRSLEMINERLDVVECFVNNQEVRSSMHKEHLSSIPDVLMLNNKLARKRANLQDVFKIYQVILRLPDMLNILESLNDNSINTVIYQPMKEILIDLKNYETMVDDVLDMHLIEKGEFMIRATFDEKLNEIKQDMDEIEKKMRKELKKSAAILGLDEGTTLKLDYVTHIGHHFRTTRKEDQTLRKHQDCFITIDTARGGIRFTTEKLKSLNEDFGAQKEIYEEQQKGIVEEIVRVASGYGGPLTNLNHAIAMLDVFISLAEVASNSPGEYVRPKMYSEDDRILSLKTLRHPCLEMQDDMEFIPNDVNLKDNETNMCIITGANISGKSTYVRSIGVAVLLAHIGSFVPCEEAHISVCDSILARIGANDNITKGLSTFMVEMVETSSILHTATKNSLVIIDELGRGTSTYEGCGIAWSVAEYLASDVKCFTLFATHFHEITALADSKATIKNFHLAAIIDNDQLTLLFKVKPGAIDRSFGIQVAEIAQIPLIVLNDAKKYLQEIESEHQHHKDDDDKVLKIEEFLEKVKNGGEYDVKKLDALLLLA